MFKTIFAFETKRWFKDYKFYLYFIIFFGLSFLTMASSVGYFDTFTVTTASNLKMNSPMMINAFISQISQFINFIIRSEERRVGKECRVRLAAYSGRERGRMSIGAKVTLTT